MKKGYPVKLLLLTAVMLGLSQAISVNLPAGYSVPLAHLGLLFLTVGAVTLMGHYLLGRSVTPAKFVQFFMALTFLRLMVYAALLVVYGLLFGSQLLGFGIFFTGVYIVYTVFEVVQLRGGFPASRQGQSRI